MLKLSCQQFILRYPGVQAIDYFLAQSITKALNQRQNELLFFSVMAVNTALREGHSCLSLDAWAGITKWQSTLESVSGDNELAGGFQFPDRANWLSVLDSLSLTPSADQPLVLDLGKLYLRRYWQFESTLAEDIKARLKLNQTSSEAEPPIDEIKDNEIKDNEIKGLLDTLFPSEAANQDVDWQKMAVANALCSSFSVIAGGPGTGKTTTVTKLLAALIALSGRAENDQPLIIKMTAPTGKAAQRLTESIRGAKQRLLSEGVVAESIIQQIPEEASTLHRLLGVIPNSYRFRHHQDNPLVLDILLVDEVSMVDLPMMSRLFSALPPQARILMLGDPDQLPSVAAGTVMADLVPLSSGYSQSRADQLYAITMQQVPVKMPPSDYLTRLLKSYRFKESGGIGVLAKQVIGGNASKSWKQLVQGNEEIALAANQALTQWLKQLADKHYAGIFKANSPEQAFELLNKFRILTPTRVGDTGVEAVNATIEKHFRQQRKISVDNGFYHGRPILITSNQYDLNLYNGDIGLLWRQEGRLKAVFPSQVDAEGQVQYRWITPSRLAAFETVYAMTIHKTQGSEFDQVALVIPDKPSKLITRELLYTGITRAKSFIEIKASNESWAVGVKAKVSRASGLSTRLGF